MGVTLWQARAILRSRDNPKGRAADGGSPYLINVIASYFSKAVGLPPTAISIGFITESISHTKNPKETGEQKMKRTFRLRTEEVDYVVVQNDHEHVIMTWNYDESGELARFVQPATLDKKTSTLVLSGSWFFRSEDRCVVMISAMFNSLPVWKQSRYLLVQSKEDPYLMYCDTGKKVKNKKAQEVFTRIPKTVIDEIEAKAPDCSGCKTMCDHRCEEYFAA
jgi:hypothetical protein